MASAGERPAGAGRARRAAPVVVALLLAWPFAAWLAARALVVRSELGGADALLVFSGSADYAERARWAAHLFREGRAPKVVLTNDGLRGGWSQSEQRNLFFYERARAELLSGGVPANRIEVLPEVVSSTHEEALLARRYAEQRGVRTLLAVTSPYHSRRALWTLRRVFSGSGVGLGLEAPPAAGTLATAAWWLSSSGWRTVGAEYLKMVYYRVAYG